MAKQNSITNNLTSLPLPSDHHHHQYSIDEESGWTVYLEDFLNDNNHEQHSCFSSADHDFIVSDHQNFSSAPDATSSVDLNFDNNEERATAAGGGAETAVAAASGFSSCKAKDHMMIINNGNYYYNNNNNNNNNNLNLKKRKMKGLLLEDDSLEDTASSPVNSPKVVSDSTYFSSKNQKQIKENLAIIPQENGGFACKNENNVEDDKSMEMGFVAIMQSDCTELKKKGLCLVPLSMLVNYLA